MIRLADYRDTKIILDLLTDFLSETSYHERAQAVALDKEHLCKLIWMCENSGYVWLAFADQEPAGLLMTIKQPNMWNKNVIELREIVWYVRPQFRKSLLGGRLFNEFNRSADQLMSLGKIDVCFTTKMATTDTINLERRGFRPTETTYIKE